MPFVTPDYQAIRDAILRDIANQLPGANTASDGDFAIRANATGAAIEGLYQHQQWVVRQMLPDTADSDYLERWCRLYGLTRKPAAMATGTIIFNGTVGSVIPIGTESKTSSGVNFATTAAGTIGAGGTTTVAAQAVLAGSASNQTGGSALTLTAAPSGIQSQATIAIMTGGIDVENDASLLNRLLARIRLPPCGGAAHDYLAWASEVGGVDGAWVYPLRRGMGTVDMIITTAEGLPSADLISAVQAHIDSVRPVTADARVYGPTPVPVAITGTLAVAPGYVLGQVVASIRTVLAKYFASLAPGETVYFSRLAAVISAVPGVVDFILSAPAANVATRVDATHLEIATLGLVTFTL
jgi:uncharacterized phage protein gp47/JayE